MEGSGDRPSERGKGSNRHATPCHAELLMATTNVSTLSYSRTRPSRPGPSGSRGQSAVPFKFVLLALSGLLEGSVSIDVLV